MNDHADHLDQTDEDILAYTVSDEALEAAGGTERLRGTIMYFSQYHASDICC